MTQRPYVICHMVPSVDGRILVRNWQLPHDSPYEKLADTFDANAWIIGRTSMEPYAAGSVMPRVTYRGKKREDFIAMTRCRRYAIGIDPLGKLKWKQANIDDDHVVMVLGDQVSDRHLRTLRDAGVSYVFGGSDKDIDVPRVLAKLYAELGIKRLLLEGGGAINGHFLAANAIDELSVIVAPVVDGARDVPTLFDRPAPRKGKARAMKLLHVEKLPNDFVWLRYRF